MKKFATLISWISLITIIVIEIVLFNTPDNLGGNIIVMVMSTPVLTCSIVAVALSSKNRSFIWWKIGLSSVVLMILILIPIMVILGENNQRESERLMREEEARESEEPDLMNPDVSYETNMILAKIQKMSRSELLNFSMENGIEFCEETHTPMKGEKNSINCEIWVHLHDSINLERCRNNVGMSYLLSH